MRIEQITAEMAEKYRTEIAQLYYDNIRACSFLDHYTLEEAYEKIEAFINHLKCGTAISYGVYEGKEICGFIWAYPYQFREEKRVYVNEIRVKEEYRNRGIGKELLRLVEEKARDMGIGALFLHVEAGNDDVIRLYQDCGYKYERIQLRKSIKKIDEVQNS